VQWLASLATKTQTTGLWHFKPWTNYISSDNHFRTKLWKTALSPFSHSKLHNRCCMIIVYIAYLARFRTLRPLAIACLSGIYAVIINFENLFRTIYSLMSFIHMWISNWKVWKAIQSLYYSFILLRIFVSLHYSVVLCISKLNFFERTRIKLRQFVCFQDWLTSLLFVVIVNCITDTLVHSR